MPTAGHLPHQWCMGGSFGEVPSALDGLLRAPSNVGSKPSNVESMVGKKIDWEKEVNACLMVILVPINSPKLIRSKTGWPFSNLTPIRHWIADLAIFLARFWPYDANRMVEVNLSNTRSILHQFNSNFHQEKAYSEVYKRRIVGEPKVWDILMGD